MDSNRNGTDVFMRCCIKLEVAVVCFIPSVLPVFLRPALTCKQENQLITEMYTTEQNRNINKHSMMSVVFYAI